MDFHEIPTPFYYIDESLLIKNLEILNLISKRTGCRILLAQKAFSMFAAYPLIGRYLHGTSASGLHEAMLGHEEMGGETHIFSAAYSEPDFENIVRVCDHIVFNSFNQWLLYRERALAAERSCGIRINPELSTTEHAMYDPCQKGSRLGVTVNRFRPELLDGISGFHFHTLCEQNADALAATLEAAEEKFRRWFDRISWLNVGGGHLITGDGYDIPALEGMIKRLRGKYGIDVYLEPGEAVALNAGFLAATVLDVVENGITTAILDASAACHMPDVLEIPYAPEVIGASKPGEKPYQCRLAGPTCLSGDIIGDYSFDRPPAVGERLVLCDMGHYTMVKNNTFNGTPLPAIAIKRCGRGYDVIRKFGYGDFKGRLS